MKKGIIRTLTAALATAVFAGMCVIPAFAANTVITDGNWIGSDADLTANPQVPGTARATVKTITVKEVNDTSSNLRVTAYQVVKGTYSDGKLTGYVLCDTANAPISNISEPTATEVTAIANNIGSNTTTLQGIVMSGSNGVYTADVEAGLYVVLVTGSDSVVYNPAVVAVNVSDANNIATSASGGTVDMTTYFSYPSNAYLKSSESGLKKSIVAVGDVSPECAKGDVVAYGDTVGFKVDEMVIPSYSSDYASPIIYKIEDKLDANGFAGITSLVVKSGATSATAAVLSATDESTSKTNYTIVYKNAEGDAITDKIDTDAVSYEVSFSDEFIRANGGNVVEITYNSTFKDSVAVNYSEHKNTATLSYSNDPTDSTKAKKKKSTTYHYTFGIDADIDADATGNFETYEINKVTEAGGTYTNGVSNKALEGAGFTLYSDEALTNAVGTAESSEKGHISFFGLDTGTYYLKESYAPPRYSINDKVYRFKIEATFDAATGILSSYKITTDLKQADNTYTNAGTATYTNKMTDNAFSVDDDGNVTNAISTSITPAEIVNTSLAVLPSTGGLGTIIITVIAAGGMAVFLTIFIVNRRKRSSKED